MDMEFKISDMGLMANASKLISKDEYTDIRERYKIRNPKRYIERDKHRMLMEESIKIAKKTIGKGGTEEEVKRACIYLYVCMDSRKYRLDWHRARKENRIDELVRKYVDTGETKDISENK